jgi:hypothetical protein
MAVYLCLVPRLRISGAKPPSLLHSFMIWPVATLLVFTVLEVQYNTIQYNTCYFTLYEALEMS